ncbi:MAG: ubiquinol-cytochrome c reductase iron-sulfur subunit [Halobacteriales archaeon]
MSADDKYPESSGRRRFVKGVVGSAALATVGTATTGAVNTMTSPSGGGGGPTTFFGIRNTAGPAPRGMPLIPVEVDSEGYLKGLFPEWETVTRAGRPVQVAEMDIAGYTYGAQWFQYCSVQESPGVQPEADQDEYFRYSSQPAYEWQQEAVSADDRVHVDDFQDYEDWGNGIGKSGLGKPAQVTWRSQGVQSGEGIIPAQVVRVPPDDYDRMVSNSEYADFIEAATDRNFVAWMNKCTHFCCVPGFKTTEQSAKFGAENEVYCPCHQSVYDPYDVVQREYLALPRPD